MNRAVHDPWAHPCLWEHESIRGGMRRVLLSCLGIALRALICGEVAEAERIHEARVALKRARAVLRLGELIGLPWTRPARLRLGRSARELAKARDAAAMAATAQRFGLMVSMPEEPPGFSPETWNRRLKAEQVRLARYRWPALSRRECTRALAASVRRLRRRELRARRGVKARPLHAWRSAVIVLREQLNVLRPLLARRQHSQAGRLHRIARKLGVVQDLTLLIAAERQGAPHAARRTLLRCARVERRQMARQARRLARGLTRKLREEIGGG